MKKKLVTSVVALSAFLAVGTLASCNNDEPTGSTAITTTITSTIPATTTTTTSEQATLRSIAITKQPTKTTYVEGEVFDKSGMEVTASYSDGKTQVVTNYLIDKTEPLKLEDKVITINYQGKTATVNITVEKRIDVTIDEFNTYRFEAENLDFSKATLREDFVAEGRSYIETPNVGETSNRQSVCGYKPGSVFEISIKLLKDATLYVTSRMSDTELNYKINEGVKFEMDETLMTAEDVQFTFNGAPNYWEWKDVVIGKIDLSAGEHTFRMTALTQRPNIDYFQFETLKYGDQVKEKVLEELMITSLPTKVTYEEGQTFDPTGMVIKAKYSDYSLEEVNDYSIDKTEPLKMTDTEVTVTYNGKSVVVPITVGKAYDVRIASLGDHKFEAENIKVDDKWILRSDMAGFGRNFTIDNSTASNGKSIERYAVGSVMTIDFYVNDNSTLALQIEASNYTNFTFDEKVEVKIDDTVLTSNNPTFGARNPSDYWNWINVKFGELELAKGGHVLTINMKGERPNLDFVNFHIKKIGELEESHTLSSIVVSKNPDKMSYNVGELFDKTGMEVKGLFEDATEEIITDYVVDKTSPLTAEDTTIKITYQDKETTLTITVKDVDFTVTEAKSVKLEAENLDFSNLVSDGNAFVESNDKSSGNASIGHINSGYIDIRFNVSFDAKLTVKALFSKYEAVSLKERIEFKLDGEVKDYTDITLGRATDGSNDWFNWKEAAIDFGTLSAGDHIVTITFLKGCNMDCVTFEFGK